MIEFVDAKNTRELCRWLRKLELLRHREVQVLVIQDYHLLLKNFQLIDEVIQDWFPFVIGLSPHLCFGKSKVFYWQDWRYQFHFQKSLCPVAIGVPLSLFPSLRNQVICYRFGCFVFFSQEHWQLYNSWKGAWKSLFYWIFFAIFKIEYADKSRRPSFK